jgi:hypothetical protein
VFLVQTTGPSSNIFNREISAASTAVRKEMKNEGIKKDAGYSWI